MTDKIKIISKCKEAFARNLYKHNKKKRKATKQCNNDYVPLFPPKSHEDCNESPSKSNNQVPDSFMHIVSITLHYEELNSLKEEDESHYFFKKKRVENAVVTTNV